MAAQFPRVTELAMSVSHEGVLGRCDDDVEFAFGLDLILDGLERRLEGQGSRRETVRGASLRPSKRQRQPSSGAT